MYLDDQVTPLLDTLKALKEADTSALPLDVKQQLDAVFKHAKELDAARGQSLNVALYEHRHGTDVIPCLAPTGLKMTEDDAVSMLDEETWEPDRGESMECMVILDAQVGILLTESERALQQELAAGGDSCAFNDGPGQ